jgi:glycosyltransferase involved in cell wall biosynthesis
MSKFKIVGFLQVYNEIRKGNLHRFTSQIFKHIDSLVVYDNGSTDGTYEHLLTKTPHIIRGSKNSFDKEIIKKQQLLELALTLKPDFILWLDCDEVLASSVDIQKLCKNMIQFNVDGVALPEINLWLSQSWQRADNLYNKGIFVRLWKIKPGKTLYFPPQEGLHRDQYPKGIDIVVTIPDSPVIHYGFADYVNLSHKYFVYRHYGQKGYNLLRILMEDGDPYNLCKEKHNVERLNTCKVDIGLFPEDLRPIYNEDKPSIHTMEEQMASIYEYRELVEKPNVSFVCLIYKSIKWLKFVYSQFLKYTDTTNHEFFFVANDPTPEVLDYLLYNHIPHFVHLSTPSQKEEFYINNVYRAYNYGAKMARGDYIVFLNSDMAFSPNWFDNLFIKLRPDNCVASRLVESGKYNSGLWGIEKNFGRDVSEYKEQEFIDYIPHISISNFTMDGGLFMPLLVRKSDFFEVGEYPEGNIVPGTDIFNPLIALKGHPCISGDVILMQKLATKGIKHQTVFDSIVYHFQQGETSDCDLDFKNQEKEVILVCNDYLTGRNGEKVLWNHLIESQKNLNGVDLDVVKYPYQDGWEKSIKNYIDNNYPSSKFLFQNASFMKSIDPERHSTVTYLQDNFVKLGYNTDMQYQTLNNSFHIIGNSISIASYYPEYDVDVIPIGVDEHIFKPRDRPEIRLKHNLPNCRIGIFVGAFNTTKGIDLLKNIIDCNPSIYWILVSKLTGDIVEFPFNGRIYNCVNQHLLAELYCASDFYINTSPEESLCLAAIEAGLCNIPLIMNNVGFLVGMSKEDKDKIWLDINTTTTVLENIELSNKPREILIKRGFDLTSNLKLWYTKFCQIQFKLDSKKYKIST